MVANPAPIIAGLVGFEVLHAFIYRRLSPAWPPGIANRGLRFAMLNFSLTHLFWEFFTPLNQFGEPLPLIALELTFRLVIAPAEGFAIAAVIERRRR